jgi:hypothetical protein
MGLTILPPDINASDWAYRGSGRAIRVGLMQLKATARRLREADRGGARSPWPLSITATLSRSSQPETAQTTLLIKAGCFDSVAGELTRPALIWRLIAIPVRTPVGLPPDSRGLFSHRQARARMGAIRISPQRASAGSLHRKASQGCRLSTHETCLDTSAGTVTPPGVDGHGKDRLHQKGEPMEFVTFEDRTGLYDATLLSRHLSALLPSAGVRPGLSHHRQSRSTFCRGDPDREHAAAIDHHRLECSRRSVSDCAMLQYTKGESGRERTVTGTIRTPRKHSRGKVGGPNGI